MYLTILLLTSNLFAIDYVAKANGFTTSNYTLMAIKTAATKYGIDSKELLVVGILESSLNESKTFKINKNGTIDVGLFQINSVNFDKCREYDLVSIKGSSMCAAKLLSALKKKHKKDYIGRYHSKTPSKKRAYQEKVQKMLKKAQSMKEFVIGYNYEIN